MILCLRHLQGKCMFWRYCRFMQTLIVQAACCTCPSPSPVRARAHTPSYMTAPPPDAKCGQRRPMNNIICNHSQGSKVWTGQNSISIQVSSWKKARSGQPRLGAWGVAIYTRQEGISFSFSWQLWLEVSWYWFSRDLWCTHTCNVVHVKIYYASLHITIWINCLTTQHTYKLNFSHGPACVNINFIMTCSIWCWDVCLKDAHQGTILNLNHALCVLEQLLCIKYLHSDIVWHWWN